jgi:Fe-S-cluster-containing dehydrogenase component
MTRGFLFDLNRCTACDACCLACTIENELPAGTSWRRVETFNPRGHPAAPRFHLSMACYHCDQPACRDACPALAYHKDETTGAVLLEAEKCIGCRYCTWACPYDAPLYDERAGVVTKCTFCHPRLSEGGEPVCAALCPTGALDFGVLNDGSKGGPVDGFTDAGIGPAVRHTPLRARRERPNRGSATREAARPEEIRIAVRPPRPKIGLRSEWPLLVFTVLAAGSVAWWTVGLLSPLEVPALPFLAAALAGIVSSGAHLGRKSRAWRAVLNLRRSWLSREVFCYGLFVLLAAATLIIVPGNPLLGWLTAMCGFAALYSMDRVYDAALRPGPSRMHSADVFLTGLFLTGLLLANGPLAALAGLIKLGLYLRRSVDSADLGRFVGLLLGTARIGLGLLFPAAVWVARPVDWQAWALAGAALGEIIDRVEFYSELDVITPRGQMAADLWKLLTGRRAA